MRCCASRLRQWQATARGHAPGPPAPSRTRSRSHHSGGARAQVRSRFAAGAAEDFGPFLEALRALGFTLERQDASNTMFVVWELRKREAGAARAAPAWPALRACQYKRR